MPMIWLANVKYQRISGIIQLTYFSSSKHGSVLVLSKSKMVELAPSGLFSRQSLCYGDGIATIHKPNLRSFITCKRSFDIIRTHST